MPKSTIFIPMDKLNSNQCKKIQWHCYTSSGLKHTHTQVTNITKPSVHVFPLVMQSVCRLWCGVWVWIQLVGRTYKRNSPSPTKETSFHPSLLYSQALYKTVPPCKKIGWSHKKRTFVEYVENHVRGTRNKRPPTKANFIKLSWPVKHCFAEKAAFSVAISRDRNAVTNVITCIPTRDRTMGATSQNVIPTLFWKIVLETMIRSDPALSFAVGEKSPSLILWLSLYNCPHLWTCDVITLSLCIRFDCSPLKLHLGWREGLILVWQHGWQATLTPRHLR